jgi:hypothetical protein
MKTTKIFLAITALSFAAASSLSSCKKKTVEEQPDTDETTAVENNMAENISDDILNMGGQASENGSLTTYRSSGPAESGGIEMAPCATVTPGSGVRTFTVDFGNGCQGKDGRIRTGKLFFDFSASSPSTALYYRNPGFNLKVTSDKYTVDGYKITIHNKSIVNTSPANLSGNLTWAINANIAIEKPNNAGTFTWTCSRTKELVNTADTNCYRGQNKSIVWSKAIVKINGSASGTNAKGESFTAVANNLVKDFNCAPDPVARPHRHPFISGTISYTPGNKLTRVMDFGNGACDLLATVTVGGKTKTINLP